MYADVIAKVIKVKHVHDNMLLNTLIYDNNFCKYGKIVI